MLGWRRAARCRGVEVSLEDYDRTQLPVARVPKTDLSGRSSRRDEKWLIISQVRLVDERTFKRLKPLHPPHVFCRFLLLLLSKQRGSIDLIVTITVTSKGRPPTVAMRTRTPRKRRFGNVTST